jgi:nitrogen fixation NifU-like protein
VVGNKFQDIILKHSRDKSFVDQPEGSWESAQEINAVCGDEATVYLRMGADTSDIRYHIIGCALCSASASVMAEQVSKASLVQGRELVLRFLADFPAGRMIVDQGTGVEALFDMRRFPARERCVLLPWQALSRLLLS